MQCHETLEGRDMTGTKGYYAKVCSVYCKTLVSQYRRIPLYGTYVGIRHNCGIIVCSPKTFFCAFSLEISFGGKYCFSLIYSLYTIRKHDSCILPFNLIKIVYCQKHLQNVILLKVRNIKKNMQKRKR
jgi:hypothetical protein